MFYKKIELKPEENLQMQCVQWFRFVYKNKLIFAIPNGGMRNVIVAYKLKLGGVLAGVPDLFIPEPNNSCNGLFIELKIKNNKCTPTQSALITKLRDRKFKCEVIYTFEDFKSLVNEYLKDCYESISNKPA